jgi:hypothetical protein
MYKSEAGRFLDELKRAHPQIEEQQRKNRATWWDRPQDLEAMRESAEAAVPQPAYVYFPLPRPADPEDQDSGNKASTPSSPA